jgi:hypothetical protein
LSARGSSSWLLPSFLCRSLVTGLVPNPQANRASDTPGRYLTSELHRCNYARFSTSMGVMGYTCKASRPRVDKSTARHAWRRIGVTLSGVSHIAAVAFRLSRSGVAWA